MPRSVIAASAVLVAFATVVRWAHAQEASSPETPPVQAEWTPGEVIVGFERAPDLSDLLRLRQAIAYAGQWRGIGPCAISEGGDSSDGSHPLACARVIKIAPKDDVRATAERIRRLPGVVYAHPNYITRPAFDPNDPLFWSHQYAAVVMRVPEAWDRTTGSARVIVAVADSGLRFDHEDLPDNAQWLNADPINGVDDDGNGYVDDVRGWDFIHGDNDPSASSAHGTHVAGIIAAGIDNGVGIAGMSRCTIMPLQVFDGPYGTWEAIAEAVIYAADNGAKVLNFSGGGLGGDGLLRQAVQYARQRGMTVVTAAGNHGTDAPYYPAAYPETIAVSGTGPDDVYYAASGRGAHIDVAAPGVGIWSCSWESPFDYRLATGTSLATAQVTGVVALMYSLNPDLTVDQVRDLLHENAVDLGDAGFDPLFGWGRVDARATLDAVPIDVTAPHVIHDGGVRTRPFSGYIDPRSENTDGVTADLGIDTVVITFSEPVRNAGSGPDGSLTAEAFQLIGAAPAYPAVRSIDATANPTVRIALTEPIPVGHWTTIVANVEDASGNPIDSLGDLGPGTDEPDRVDLGFLPGDIDQSGSVDPFDLLALRRLTAGQWHASRGGDGDYADVDRNGLVEPLDVLVFRRTITGTGQATRPWAGQALPTRP